MVADIAYLQQTQQQISQLETLLDASARPIARTRCRTPASASSG